MNRLLCATLTLALAACLAGCGLGPNYAALEAESQTQTEAEARAESEAVRQQQALTYTDGLVRAVFYDISFEYDAKYTVTQDEGQFLLEFDGEDASLLLLRTPTPASMLEGDSSYATQMLLAQIETVDSYDNAVLENADVSSVRIRSDADVTGKYAELSILSGSGDGKKTVTSILISFDYVDGSYLVIYNNADTSESFSHEYKAFLNSLTFL